MDVPLRKFVSVPRFQLSMPIMLMSDNVLELDPIDAHFPIAYDLYSESSSDLSDSGGSPYQSPVFVDKPLPLTPPFESQVLTSAEVSPTTLYSATPIPIAPTNLEMLSMPSITQGQLSAPNEPKKQLSARIEINIPCTTGGDSVVYVNAKQYHRILKRREDRARLERDGKIPARRAKYLHESRHLHAVNRVRGKSGRFLGVKVKDLNKTRINYTVGNM